MVDIYMWDRGDEKGERSIVDNRIEFAFCGFFLVLVWVLEVVVGCLLDSLLFFIWSLDYFRWFLGGSFLFYWFELFFFSGREGSGFCGLVLFFEYTKVEIGLSFGYKFFFWKFVVYILVGFWNRELNKGEKYRGSDLKR